MNLNTLHKIPGVDKNVCTAEQVVAYNFAQTFRRVWSAQGIADYAAKCMAEDPRRYAKFNQDAIVHLIRTCTGVTYPGGIAASYWTVAEWFPLS